MKNEVKMIKSLLEVTRNRVGHELHCCSRDSSVGIATGYGLDDRSSIPGRDKIFLFSIAPVLALGSTHPPIQCVRV
jgi:hypothetical protein